MVVFFSYLDWLVKVTQTLNFVLVSHHLFYFLRSFTKFLLMNNGEQFEESMFDLRICLMKG